MFLEIILLCVAVLVYLYISLTDNFAYWKRKGVHHYRGTIVLEILWDQLTGRIRPLGEVTEKWCKDYKEKGLKYFGNWTFFQPTLYILDLELSKHILTKDFNHFVTRDFALVSHEYITKHLFALEGQEWKEMRVKLTPTFTSGKIKNMFALMKKCAEQLQDHIEHEVLEVEEVEVKDLIGRFTTDVIATCAFGVDTNSIEDPQNEFYQTGKTVFSLTRASLVNYIMIKFFPTLSKQLNLKTVNPKVTKVLTTLMRETTEYRKKNNVVRNDFVDLLMKVKENKCLDDEVIGSTNQSVKTEGKSAHPDKDWLTLEEMTAQAFVFFVAGFETSASVTSFCFYELAKNPDVQERLQSEIDEVLSRHGGEITYQALQDMTYMDQVMNETLRRYASLPFLTRVCTQPYLLPGTDLVIDKGVRVNIPTYAIHHDPEIYPDPYKFDPERFSEENSKDRHHYAFLPFGEGPRNCIGARFGKLQVNIGLAAILSRYQLSPAPDTPSQLELKPYTPFTTPKHPFSLRICRRTNL